MPNPTCEYPGCATPQALRGYCRRCYKRARRAGLVDLLPPQSVEDRFWGKVEITGFCWNWTASAPGGYGKFGVGTRVTQKTWSAHRFAYESLVGSIPDGYHLDHLCRNTRCVNPDHLDPVPAQVNNIRSFSLSAQRARQTHCHKGHEFSDENTYVDSRGRRTCIACAKDWRRTNRKSRAKVNA
jgi:hypothetical protein